MSAHPPFPAWLSVETIQAMRVAADKAHAGGRNGAAAAREVAWGHYPALPASMIGEAVEAALGAEDG